MREIMLIVHILGLLLAISPVAIILFSRLATSKMEEAQASGFRHGLFRMVTIAHIGVTLSLLSGGYLMTPFWSTLGARPFLMAKLGIYFVLLFTITMISISARRARESKQPGAVLIPMNWARISFVLGLLMITLAVVVFK